MYDPPPPGQPPVPRPEPAPQYGMPSGPASPEFAPANVGLATPGRRAAAFGIEVVVLAVIVAVLSWMTYSRLHTYISHHGTGMVLDTLLTLLTSGGDVGKAAEKLGATVWHAVVSKVQQAFLLLVVIEFIYQYVGLAWKGRTAGKALVDIQVRRPGQQSRDALELEGGRFARFWVCLKTVSGPGAGPAARRAAVVTMTDTGLYAVAWILLLHGKFMLAVLVWLLALAAFIGNWVPILQVKRRAISDRFAGTIVVRTDTHERAAEAARAGAQVVWDGTQAATQVAVEGAKEGAQWVAQNERVQQALASERVQQGKDLSRRAGGYTTDKARRVMETRQGQQAQDLGKRVGGKFKDAYQKRRDSHQAPQPPPAAGTPGGQYPLPQPGPRTPPHATPRPPVQQPPYTPHLPPGQPPRPHHIPPPPAQQPPPPQPYPPAQPGQWQPGPPPPWATQQPWHQVPQPPPPPQRPAPDVATDTEPEPPDTRER